MPKPPTKLAEVMITTYYGKRPLRWIGDQLGCSAPTVLAYAKRLGLSQPTRLANREVGNPLLLFCRSLRPSSPPHANHPFIPPPTREHPAPP